MRYRCIKRDVFVLGIQKNTTLYLHDPVRGHCSASCVWIGRFK
ncbi:unnamed protein product [Spodoptera littoralis]|uniref:Uncharacterized protein n=1 Tax=Spodoptera littoralis TaxID=7109 RepID=A0A9P0IJ09_SPOLI|nr:unnamed protein product [Spodoptera littoralis]